MLMPGVVLSPHSGLYSGVPPGLLQLGINRYERGALDTVRMSCHKLPVIDSFRRGVSFTNMKKRKPSSKAASSKKKDAAKPRAKQASPPVGDEITQSAAFRKATSDAESYVRDSERLRKLFEDAVGKI